VSTTPGPEWATFRESCYLLGTNAKDARREDHHGACKLGEIMATIYLLGLAVAPFLPETRGKSLPETI